MALIEDLITPEINKLEKVRGHSKHLYEFLTWMKENKKKIGKDVEDLILEYYQIDKIKIKKEREMLRKSLEKSLEEQRAECTTNTEL